MLAYVLVPVPGDPGDFCERHHIDPNLIPVAFHNGSGSAVVQLGLNILLFIPLGALVYEHARHRIAVATIAGFALSLLVELTQLTGVWFVYPCAYRHFNVDDLIFNTLGATLGALAVAAARRHHRQVWARRPVPASDDRIR